MASFPLAAMSATTCWGPNAHCSRSTCAGDWLLHDRHVATKPDLIFIALGTIAVGNGLFKLTQPACFRSAIRRKIRGLMRIHPVLYVDQYRLVDSVIAGPVIADRFGYSVTYNLCGAG